MGLPVVLAEAVGERDGVGVPVPVRVGVCVAELVGMGVPVSPGASAMPRREKPAGAV